MADKAISELISAEQITATDMFVLEQNGTAKKLTGQILLNWLTKAADGHGGIQSIEKTGTSGLTDTYRIMLADTTVFDFVVTNGKSVNSITKTAASGLVDTYAINYNDGTIGTFTVTNGAKGDKGDDAYVWIKYASQEPTSESHSIGDIPDSWIGIYSGNLAAAPSDWTKYDWFRIKGEKGGTGDPATLVSATVTYQVSDSGTIIPSGTWSASIPAVAQGKYLWTKIVQNFNTGNPVTSYSVARMGIDGLGSVISVCGADPDENGNVALDASHVGALPLKGGDMAGPINMNGQKLSGLNAPTEDTEAATKGYALGLVKSSAPRNLLDNSDFTNPVNQRGATSYAGAMYGIDRWYTGAGSCLVTVEDGFIRMSQNTASGSTATETLRQKVANAGLLSGKSLTLCAKVRGSNVRILIDGVASSDYVTNDEWVTLCVPCTVPSGTKEILACIQTSVRNEWDCEWIALYEGEYTAETLPEYRPKGYAAELTECMRYCQIRSTSDVPAADMRPPMRLSTPTITEVASGYEYSADL